MRWEEEMEEEDATGQNLENHVWTLFGDVQDTVHVGPILSYCKR